MMSNRLSFATYLVAFVFFWQYALLAVSAHPVPPRGEKPSAGSLFARITGVGELGTISDGIFNAFGGAFQALPASADPFVQG